MKTQSQEQRILKYLQRGFTLTPLQALAKFDCWALSSRVSDLNKEGAGIQKKTVTQNGKSFAKYFIPKPYTETARFKRLAKEYLLNDDKNSK